MKKKRISELQHDFFLTKTTYDVSFRLESLNKLYNSIRNNEKKIYNALKKDLNKSQYESYITEIGIIYSEISYIKKHLKRWAKPSFIPSSLAILPGICREYHEPYGTVLIISPWNYPILLCLQPLIGAIAAGNCAVIKPSELAPHTSSVIATIIKECFPEKYITVEEGGKEKSEELLKSKFDFIFYTGSERIGKIVMKYAAENLTPVCLELGGKSPCIVDNTADLKRAARRIAFGKILNAGQTCVAPDYLFVHSSVKQKLIELIIQEIEKTISNNPLEYNDYPSIINEHHTERLKSFMTEGNIIYGGKTSDRRIEPTLLDELTLDSKIMKEEIFGPLLPIFTYENINEVIDYINSNPKPLALYVFSRNKNNIKKVITKTSFGGGCINDTVMHVASHHMRFGGVGNSGIGNYHGKHSYELFSHKKDIMKQTNLIDLPLRYHPYNKKKYNIMKNIIK